MISNLEYYRAFYYTAVLGSFSAAAQKLCLTQSAVSQSVGKLEKELECTLFERRPLPVRLTDEGKILMENITQVFQLIQKAEQEVRDRTSEKKERLTIGATETSLYYGLPEKIQAFQQWHPSVKIQLCGSTTPELIKMLQDKKLEVAFLILTPSLMTSNELGGMEVRQIAEIRDRPAASASFGLSTDDRLQMKDLIRYPLIAQDEHTSVRQLLDHWFIENGMVFAPQYSVNSTAEVLKMVKSGLGIGILPERIIEDEAAANQLIALHIENYPKPRHLAAVIRKNVHSNVATAFVDVVAEKKDFSN